MNLAVFLLTAVTAERLGELWLARRNTDRLLRAGAREVAAEHYLVIVALHALWLASLWRFGWGRPVNLDWLAVFLVLQALRVWTLSSLGPRWTTRIIVAPNAPLTTKGPYRYFSHPNYLVVVGEIAVLPLCLGLPWLAIVFSVLNAAILTVRVRAENAALAGIGDVANR